VLVQRHVDDKLALIKLSVWETYRHRTTWRISPARARLNEQMPTHQTGPDIVKVFETLRL